MMRMRPPQQGHGGLSVSLASLLPALAAAETSVFYADPHICTACRYRADDMLWRCPHCHEWNTFVEERLGPMAGTR